MTERWKQAVLYVAASWNVLGGVSALLDPASHFRQLYFGALRLDDPLQAFFFRAVWINVIAWGVGYALAARWPVARAPILVAGGLGKLAYFGACVALFAAGGGGTPLLTAGALDLAFAAMFASVLWLGRPGHSLAGRPPPSA